MLISGGEVNTERAAIMLVDEFRASKWGPYLAGSPSLPDGGGGMMDEKQLARYEFDAQIRQSTGFSAAWTKRAAALCAGRSAVRR